MMFESDAAAQTSAVNYRKVYILTLKMYFKTRVLESVKNLEL